METHLGRTDTRGRIWDLELISLKQRDEASLWYIDFGYLEVLLCRKIRYSCYFSASSLSVSR